MTRDEAIQEACEIMALVYLSVGSLSTPSDGFCSICEKKLGEHWKYENAGEALEYMRRAVLEKLKRDGVKVDDGFNERTGKLKEGVR